MPTTVLTRNVSDAFRLRPGGPLAWPAGRALLSMAVPLGVLLAIGRLDLLPGAVFGALTSVHCRNEAHPRQARTLGVVAIGMVAAVTTGDLIAVFAGGQPWHEPIAMLATALAGAIGTVAATAVKIGPPGGLIFTFAVGACSHLPLQAAGLGAHFLTIVASTAFAWTVTVLGTAASGLNPQRRAVAAALDATADALADRADLALRHRAAVAVETAWNGVALVGRRQRDTGPHRDLVRAVENCEALLSPDAPAVQVHEVRTAAREVRAGRPFAEPHGRESAPAVPPTPVSRWWIIRDVLRAALLPHRVKSWLMPYAARVVLAALLAGVAAGLLGIEQTYWAAVSAVSILQATSTAGSVPRMLQRVCGTVLGVLVAVAVLHAGPPVWVLVVLLAVLQWGAEMTVTVNYAFGLLFATPVALLVSALGTASDPGVLGWNRFWATLLGAAIAVAVAWALPNRAWLSRVQAALTRVRRLSESRPLQPARLRSALVELHEAHDVAAGEVRPSELPTEELLELSHRAYALLDATPARR
ncbi:FUSC family protein [Saccharopolyspora sp. SCSIO 74807]|uniref:FUSC family protein n=2 Tax=unclassified Saccharopolyspora TaxID=2646250 RepID=UPI0030D38551